MNDYYAGYDEKYPDLIIKILEYFDISNNADLPVAKKSVIGFCEKYQEKEGKGSSFIYQPNIVDRICRRLCECNQITCIKNDGGLGLQNNYMFILNKSDFFEKNKRQLSYYFNSMVYGFEYIYRTYKDSIVPLVWEKTNGDYAVGTGFAYLGGIVTAKHCVTDVTNLQIKGYKASELKDAKIYISDNPGLDLAFIETNRYQEPQLFCEDGEVMQDVLVMGYPKIPAFTNFLTAEKATISSKASSRITPTKGAIAAFGTEYLARIEAMLITAKIKGGNSGGPVINSNGCLVGIACQVPNYEGDIGDYDDLGYGIAVPVKYLNELIRTKPVCMDVPVDFFRDFIE